MSLALRLEELKFGPEHRFSIPRFSIENGEKVLLMGPSGCGKTSFLEYLVGFRPGRATLFDLPSPPSLVFQDLNLIDAFSVVENLRLELDSERADRVLDWLKQMELPDVGGKLIRHLSKGEQQRVAVTRALARGKFFMADEPTSHLDRRRATQLIELIVKTAETALIVSHDQRLEKYFDRVVAFEDLVN